MTIDWENERVIPLRDVTKHVKSRVSGKRLSVATVWRWALRKNTPLETFKTPGGRFTSIEAVGRFLERCTGGQSDQTHGPVAGRSGYAQVRPTEKAVEAGAQLRRLIGGA